MNVNIYETSSKSSASSSHEVHFQHLQKQDRKLRVYRMELFYEEYMGMHELRFGAYYFLFVDQLSPGQTCPICLVAMRNPVQTICGHRFCEDCLLGTFRFRFHLVCSSVIVLHFSQTDYHFNTSNTFFVLTEN